MNRVTVATWLEVHGPCTSLDLREKMGITAKGTPISGHLSTLARDGFAKKKKVGNVNVFTITKKGAKWSADRPSELETVEQINANTYSKGSQTKAKVRLPNSETVENALEGISDIVKENQQFRAGFESLYVQIGQLLGK